MEAVGRRYRSRHVAGRGGVKCAGGHLSVRGGHGPHGSVAMRTVLSTMTEATASIIEGGLAY